MHLRCDQYFVEDEAWHQAESRFSDFLQNMTEAAKKGYKVVLLELGVGFNTPTIIRFPFEKLMREYDNINMIRLNLNEAVVPLELGNRIAGINEDMDKSIHDIMKVMKMERAALRKKPQRPPFEFVPHFLKVTRGLQEW